MLFAGSDTGVLLECAIEPAECIEAGFHRYIEDGLVRRNEQIAALVRYDPAVALVVLGCGASMLQTMSMQLGAQREVEDVHDVLLDAQAGRKELEPRVL